MFLLLAGIAALVYGVISLKKPLLNPQSNKKAEREFAPLGNTVISFALILFGIFGLFSRSFVIVESNEIGLLNRIYMAEDLPAGRIIGLEGQKGPQAKILGPGFHLMPFVQVLYDVETENVMTVPEGHVGFVVAKDGQPLRDGQFIADKWVGNFEDMLKAEHFLSDGQGQKGPQLDVLRPGTYRLNPYLFDVKISPALDVPTGHVAVIRSNVQTYEGVCPNSALTTGTEGGQVAQAIVPKGCVGVWDEPLKPGRYYMNPAAFVPTLIDTRLNTWNYKGGYTKRMINLTVSDDGKIQQQETKDEIPVPKDAADGAITTRVEGWVVPVDMRVIVQVHPKNAPLVVASVGNLEAVENKLITPAIRDILRTIGGNPERKVMDFVQKRDEIVGEVETSIIPEGLKAGVSIQDYLPLKKYTI